MKKIDLSKMKRKDLGDLIKEAKLLEMFDHPNIVKLVDYFATPDTLCIVQEYCSARDLAWEVKEMRKTKKFFQEDCIWSWFVIYYYMYIINNYIIICTLIYYYMSLL